MSEIIIGINDSHDATASLFIDGCLICAFAEERLQRVKSMGGFPINAIKKCLQEGKIKKSDVNHIAIATHNVSPLNLHNWFPSLTIEQHYRVCENYWRPVLKGNEELRIADVLTDFKAAGNLSYPMEEIPFMHPREMDNDAIAKIKEFRHSFISEYFKLPHERVHFVDHHSCHAHYAHYCNPYRNDENNNSFLVITADAGGDGKLESVSIYKNEEVELLHSGKTCYLAPIYSYITLLTGMRPNEHEYKVMGMAPYVKDYNKKKALEVFHNVLNVEGLKFVRNEKVGDLFSYFQKELKTIRFDGIMGAVQEFTEALTVQWVKNIIDQTGIRNIAFSGGLSLNIKTNKLIWEIPEVESFFVPPGAGDESLAIGASLRLMDKLGNPSYKKSFTVKNAYFGNSAPNAEVEEFLNSNIVNKLYNIKRDASPKDIAERLAMGEICAIFIGDMEFGPRALGHRSIIADPSKPETVKKINEAIKMRDFWMPFTFSVLDDYIEKYIDCPKNIDTSFMTVSFDTTTLGKEHLAGAIHPYDKTARPQKVNKETCPVYHSIIKAFSEITGIGAVLNTSLNMHGKPIVMKPIHIADEILNNNNVILENIFIEGTLLYRKTQN